MQAFRFTCSKCDYGFTGAGERSALFAGPTWTIVCLDCADLQDVIVWGPQDLEGSGRWSVAVPDPGTQHLTEPKCHEDARHRVKEWTHPGTCPKCGSTMDRDEDHIIMAD